MWRFCSLDTMALRPRLCDTMALRPRRQTSRPSRQHQLCGVWQLESVRGEAAILGTGHLIIQRGIGNNLSVVHLNHRTGSRTSHVVLWHDYTRLWFDWVKYTDPIIELCLMPDKQKLLETTVPYYAIEGCKPARQTLGRAGMWKKIAQIHDRRLLGN